MADNTKDKRTLINLLYIFAGPIFVIILVFFIIGSIKLKAESLNNSNNSQNNEQIEVIMPSAEEPIDINSIISGAIDKTDVNTNNSNEISATDNSNKEDYSSMTVEEIINGKSNAEEDEKLSFIEKDLAIKYEKVSYLGLTKDGAFVVDMDGETKYIYLTAVTNINSEELYFFLDGVENLYVEYDIQKKRGQGEQAYIWLKEPNNNHKEYMINGIVLENGWGQYMDSSPNIKYTYYFLDIK